MGRRVLGRVEPRHGHCLRRVEPPELRRREQGEMGKDETRVQDPWPFALRRLLPEPGAAGIGNASVLASIGRFAWSHVQGIALHARPRGRWIALETEEVPDAVVQVHRQQFNGEAVVVVDAPEMVLADRHDPVPVRLQVMAPGGKLAVVGVRLVPAVVLVHVATGGEAGARRRADRARRVGLGETCARARQAVQIRRPDDSMAVAAEDAPGVLVGENYHHVGRSHHDPPAIRSPRFRRLNPAGARAGSPRPYGGTARAFRGGRCGRSRAPSPSAPPRSPATGRKGPGARRYGPDPHRST